MSAASLVAMEQKEIRVLMAERMCEIARSCSGYDQIQYKIKNDEVLADLRRALEEVENA